MSHCSEQNSPQEKRVSGGNCKTTKTLCFKITMEISSSNASAYDNEHDVKIDSTTKHKT